MKKLIYILATLILFSCSKKMETGENISLIVLDTSIENETGNNEQPSKAAITETKFKNGNTLGLFIYYTPGNNVDRYTLYSDKYKNVRSSYVENQKKWNYRFEGSSSSFEELYLIKPNIATFENGLDIYAYAPWIEGAPSITEIQYTVGGDSKSVIDLMWAKQNNENTNSGINLDKSNTVVKLTFQHACSLLWLGFKCKNTNSEIKVSSVSLKRNTETGTTDLYGSAVFNAIDGTFTKSNSDKCDIITTNYIQENYSFTNGDEYKYVPFIILPGEYNKDGDYILEFTFNSLSEPIRAKFPIKKNDIGGSFVQGKSYTFLFDFDNYIQIKNVIVSSSDKWPVVKNEFTF